MTSTPSSVFSSPSRRPSSSRPSSAKLSRRWSLDNINSKEGYVRDLRKQHQAQQVGQRDEAYPFMMTEHRRRGRVGSLNLDHGPKVSSNTRPLSCSPPAFAQYHHSAAKRTRTMSLDEESELKITTSSLRPSVRSKRLGSVPLLRGMRNKTPGTSSVDLSTSTVPEDFELTVDNEAASPTASASVIATTSDLFRKRSSSLPRILPPILDRDDAGLGQDEDDALGVFEDNNEVGSRLSAIKQMEQTSNIIVREMQKFVCRHASDVSQVLPLPLPANARQSSSSSLVTSASTNTPNMLRKSSKLDWKHTRILMQNLAKLHAISYAIRDKSPGLFQEIAESLQQPPPPAATVASNSGRLNGGLVKRHVDLDNKAMLIKILETQTPLFEEGCYEEIIKSVRSQASELYAVHACPLFPVVVHGSVRNLLFKYSSDEVIGVKLPSLRFATIGSPLIDIFAALHSAKSLHETSSTIRGHLQTYHASFTEVATCLRGHLRPDFTLDKLEAAFKNYELTGMIISSLRKYSPATMELGRSCSLGGRDMLLFNRSSPISEANPAVNNIVHDLGSDLSKLAIEIPYSHQESDEDFDEQ